MEFQERANAVFSELKKRTGVGLTPVDGQIEEAAVVMALEELFRGVRSDRRFSLEDKNQKAFGPSSRSRWIQ